MTDTVAPLHACRNCAAALTGPYCAECGQKAEAGPPTVRDFLHEAAEDVFNYDGKLLRTLRLLFLHPGRLTRELVAGHRARYVRPLRLYLTFSVIAFGVMALTSEAPIVEERDAAEMGDGVRVTTTRRPQFGVTTDMMTEEQRLEMGQQIVDGMPTFMFLMVPAFAAIVMLVMRGSGRTYPQHLFFAFHLHAFVFAITALLLPLNLLGRTAEGISALSRMGLSVAYGVAALRVAYGLRWWGAIWRSGLVLVGYFVWMIIAIVVIAAVFLGWWATRLGSAPPT